VAAYAVWQCSFLGQLCSNLHISKAIHLEHGELYGDKPLQLFSSNPLQDLQHPQLQYNAVVNEASNRMGTSVNYIASIFPDVNAQCAVHPVDERVIWNVLGMR